MPAESPAGRGGRGGRDGVGWSALRKNLLGGQGSSGRRVNQAKMAQFRFKSQRSLSGGARAILPEEGTDLHNHFRTCPSLTRIREEFRSAMSEGSGGNARSGKNACARAERGTGQLLLHSIGSNGELVTSGGGGTAAAQSRINQFVLKELLPAYPAAMIEEDDKGHIPFTEPIIRWIQARRAVRKWKIDTDMTREKVALVAAKLNKKIGVAAVTRGMDGWSSDSDSEDSFSMNRPAPVRLKRRSTSSMRSMSMVSGMSSFFSKEPSLNLGKQARTELKMIVDSANDAMFCIDEKGKILLTNRMAQQTFGYSKKEMLGGNISMICNKKDAEHHGEYLERYLRTGEKRVMGKKRELLARRKDGSTFFIELGLTEVNMGGGHMLFCGFVKDATDVRRHRSSLECGLNGSKDQEEKGDQAIQARGIPPLVEWCLQILSEFVNTYGFSGHQTGHEADDDFDDDSSSDGSILRSSLRSSLQGRSFRSMRNLGGDISQAMHDTIVVEKLASIPHLLEELLLIEDPEARNRVFDMSIVHKVLFNVESLDDGQWLVDMLDKSIKVQKQKVLDANLTGSDIDTVEARAFQRQLQMAHDQCRVLAESAVFYLEQVSSLNIQDDLHVFHNMQMHRELTSGGMADMISTGDVRHFENRQNELFDAVGEAKGLIRRICVLEDDLVKRAAATPVIRRLLDKIMFSPFATLSALFDGINHLLLMISFRLGPAPAVFYLAKNNDAFKPQQYLIASIVLTASVSYFGTKAIHQNLAKRTVSENLFWADAFNFWSLLDIIPLLMVFVCSVAVDIVLRARANSDSNDASIPFFLRAAIALTTPFLWLRILAFIKVRNKQLATFILCSVEIMKDIKWFLLVLFAAMASFAQMWVSFTLEPHEAESQHYMEGYFKAYTMMLGDLDSEALRIHPLIAILFVLYTFMVTIVLLNILIAIVSDSYQNSFVSSKMMLGKARVMFVSDLLNQRTFHDMWMAGKAGTTRKNVNYVFGTVAAVHIWMVTRTIIAKQCQVELCGVDTLSPSRVRLEAIFAFTASVFMIYSMKACIVHVLNEFNDTGRARSSDSRKSSGVQRAVNWFVNNAFSALSKSFDSLFDREDSHKEIGHSPAAREYRTDKAIQRSIEKTKKHLKSELKGMFEQMQLSIKELEEENKKDMAKIEDLITTAIADSHDLLLNAIQIQDGTVREQISVEDEESESSQDSLSMDDIDSRRSSLETGDR